MGWTVALGALLLTSVIGASAEPAKPAFVQVRGETQRIEANAAIGDLLAVDATVEIHGVVRGHVYAIDSEIQLGPHAVVLGSMTLTRGSVSADPKTRWSPQVYLIGADLKSDAPKAEGIQIERFDAPADEAIALTKKVLAFSRFAPPEGTEVRNLRGWHPGLGLATKRFSERAPKLLVGGITRLSFVSDNVLGSFQRGYRGDRGAVLFTGVHLRDAPAAEALWAQIAQVETKVNLEASVKIELGEGAHWFFRRGGRSVMLWHTQHWFFAVEAMHAGPKNAAEDGDRWLAEVLESLASSAQASQTSGDTP